MYSNIYIYYYIYRNTNVPCRRVSVIYGCTYFLCRSMYTWTSEVKSYVDFYMYTIPS